MEETAHVWDPLSPTEAQELFSGLSAPWWISGGWAIDLFIGHQTRPHGDLDVLILRDDQLIFQEHLSDWDLSDRRSPEFTTWSKGEFLDPPINDIWGRRTPESPWAIQLMLMEIDGDSWVFRREPKITGPISSLGRITKSGIPYLSPQIQLLYKANNLQIDRNNADFRNTLPFLNYEEAAWLKLSLERCYPGHEWISKLSQTMNNSTPIQLSQYQPIWKREFNVEKRKLWDIFGTAAIEIEHIGSTSIEKLPSKPIIDIAVKIENHKDADGFIKALAQIGYDFYPTRSSTERHFFAKGTPVKFHLSIAYTDRGEFWDRQILFRDFLRSNQEARDEYAKLKEELLRKDPSGKGYTEGKTDFVHRILYLAGKKGKKQRG